MESVPLSWLWSLLVPQCVFLKPDVFVPFFSFCFWFSVVGVFLFWETLDKSEKNLDNDVKFLKSDVLLYILLSGCFLVKVISHGEGAVLAAVWKSPPQKKLETN